MVTTRFSKFRIIVSHSCDFQSKFANSISPGKYGNDTRFSKFRIIVKPVLSDHSKIDKTKILVANGS